MRLLGLRIAAVFFALTWLVLPGFGLIDLSVTWDPTWPVVLEASWGVFMTMLIGGSFLALAVRPSRPAAPTVTLLVSLGALLTSAAAGLEVWLLGYAGILAVETAATVALAAGLPGREPFLPRRWERSTPMLVVAAVGVLPWLVHADAMLRANRGNAGDAIGELTADVDHHAVQGGLALALSALALLAAWWPAGRLLLGIGVGLCAGYVGLVSLAFPGTPAGLGPTWSAACLAWGVAIGTLAVRERPTAGRARRRGRRDRATPVTAPPCATP